MGVLDRKFYAQDTVTVAKKLLGKQIIRKVRNITISGTITETEAYKYTEDPASHAYRGITERNKVMFGQVGRAYVYFTYGMYYCVNAVARDKKSMAGAVLIRAVRPDTGIKHMIKNRKTEQIKNLTNGPAKLAQAMQIDKKQYGIDLTKKSELYITDAINTHDVKIQTRPRVGISQATDKMWNFRLVI